MNSKHFSSILAILLVFLISITAHFPFISSPKQFTEPEVQYLIQIENYFTHRDFKLIQPPLSNLFYSLIVSLQYNKIFSAINYSIQFSVLLRIIPALFSSLVLPMITLILIMYDVPVTASFLCGTLLAFEPSWCGLNRLFNPNSFFYFFSVLTILISKTSEMYMFNKKKYFILKQIEAILFAITICSDSSGIIILIILSHQCNKITNNNQGKPKSDIKSKFLEFYQNFRYHLIYSAVLFIITLSTHIFLVSGSSNKSPFFSQFFELICNILMPTNFSEIFTVQKLRNIHVSKHIQILNNPAILLLIYIGIILSIYYRESTFSVATFFSFILSFRFKEELLWKTPFLFILSLLSLGLATKNLSFAISSLILITAFCCSLLFYVILFSKSYGGQIVL